MMSGERWRGEPIVASITGEGTEQGTLPTNQKNTTRQGRSIPQNGKLGSGVQMRVGEEPKSYSVIDEKSPLPRVVLKNTHLADDASSVALERFF